MTRTHLFLSLPPLLLPLCAIGDLNKLLKFCGFTYEIANFEVHKVEIIRRGINRQLQFMLAAFGMKPMEVFAKVGERY